MIVSGHNSCWGTNVSGHKRVCLGTFHVCAQSCLGTNVSRHSHVWAQSFEHNHVWTQMCVGTNVCGHKRIWAQTCLGTNVCGHSHAHVWAQTYGTFFKSFSNFGNYILL